MDIRISDAELDVMEALWSAAHPLTAADLENEIEYLKSAMFRLRVS